MAKLKKPVVVSMGDMAASGGYYISCNANKIVANPFTLTGSIGVFGILPNINKFSKSVGINTENVKTHKDANGYIFDGFPRTLNQAKSLDDFLSSINLKINATMALDVNEDELITRLLDRGKNTNRSDDQDLSLIHI